jgi:excisionase family DNA binding protein
VQTISPQVTGRAALSIPEVMGHLGLGRDTVYGLIRSGRLTARKVGRRTIITAADLQKFLDELPAIEPAA